jgi:hypothetical protein
MSGLAAQLAQLTAELARVAAPLTSHWRPGRDPAEVTMHLEAAGVSAHPDVVSWFSWHDGTDTTVATEPPGWPLPSSANRLFGSMHLPTLAQADLFRASSLAHNVEWEPLGLEPYRASWYPVLTYADALLVCVDTDGTAGPPGTVFRWSPDGGYDPASPVAWFPDLTAMVRAITAAYRSGAVDPHQSWVEPGDLPPDLRRLVY